MQKKWESLKQEMSDLDSSIDEIQADKKNQQLRDSISSMLSNDRSTVGSIYDTPGSSPASSVVMSGLNGGPDHTTPVKNGKTRSSSKPNLPQPGNRRNSSLPVVPRKSLANRMSTVGAPAPSVSETHSPASRQGSATPTGNRLPRPSLTHQADGRPRWNSSVNTQGTIIGHNFKPLSLTTPSPHARTKPPSTHSNHSNVSSSQIPLRSPLSRDNTASPPPEITPSRRSSSRSAFRDRISSPGPYSQEVLSRSSPARPRLVASKSSISALANSTNRRASLQPAASDPTALSSPMVKQTRPVSSLATNRRVSLLPQPRGRQNPGVTGRESPQAIAGAASALRNSSQTSSGK